MLDTVDELRCSDTFKRVTYKSINPEISVHCVYTERYTINKTHSFVSAVTHWSVRPAGGAGEDRVVCPWMNACVRVAQYKQSNMLLRFAH